jgi:uncharacterized RDD family membrane protein YckC
MEQDILTRFGVSWPLLLAQVVVFLLVVAAFILAIRATLLSARSFRGMRAPIWILICWILPVVGPIAALAAARRQSQTECNRGA